ncbi:Serine/threonine-protein phosphatase 6 regulatory ankyrin repeat subunit B [Cercospora beticola]|nr:Serine/threonine-protein phosphatase 6 regulatory ankyrin repeat subunit B [Cercospora beticola]PIA80053.1 Serine/threonine-protein phosphatase 6 regulatory ankyrin repeat subunit B [Cercospora beticola]
MFFFNSHDDTALSFFESLTKQLIATLIGIDVPSSRDILSALETAYGNDISRPHIAQVFEDLVVPLCQILQQITLVIDGIDECRAAEVKQPWHWLERLLKLVQPRILITSEDQANISPRFKGFHRIRIDHLHNQFDIDTYINERIASKSSAGQVLYDESLRDEVKVTLHQKANGMFLWIHLVLNIILEDCETPAQVRKAVDEIPPDLQAVYSLCLENRRGTARPIKANLFLWTCAAPNPLSIGALGELIAMDLETGHVDTDEIPFADVLLKSGAGLITLDTSAIPNAQSDEHLVIPVHSTVRDFIFSERFRSLAAKASHQESWPLCVETGQWSENTFRTALGSLCLSHIKQRTSRELGSRPPPTRLVVPQPKVLQSVAWVQKILIGVRSKSAEMTAFLPVPGRNKTRVSTTNFLRYSIENWLVCNTNLASATANFPWLAKENQKSDLHTAAEFFEEISIERNDFYGIHPWKAAARTSNSHLSQMFAYAVANNHVPLIPLAQHGQMLAIHVAAKKGFASIIEELVNICNVNAMCPSRRQHVLHFIAENGTEDCLQPILSMNLDWNARNRDGRTALFVAMVAGHDDIVKALLEAEGFEVDEEATFCQVLLHWAVYHGHDKVKQLLLDTGKAAIDEEKEWYYDLLSWAARNGYDKIVQLLLDISKAASDEQNKWYDAILSWAAHNSYDEIVGPLLETGAVNSTDKDGLTPLYRASLRGLDKVVQLLLDTGEVDVNAATKDGRTPFYWAARFGHDKVVQLLIETGKVDVNAADKNAETSFYLAIYWGHDKVVRLLLETGNVNVNAANNNGETPLHCAASRGHEHVVQLLLGKGKAEVDAADHAGRTALISAASSSHDKVVQLLLTRSNADIKAADHKGQTALDYARSQGHERIVQLLERLSSDDFFDRTMAMIECTSAYGSTEE